VVLTHGEAFFAVVHRADWPFSVRAGSATIRAVGTKFSVRLREDDEADVIVIEAALPLRAAQRPPLEASGYRRGRFRSR